MLTVLGRRSSINVQKVAWLLAELDLPHRHIELGGTFGGLDTPEFRMMNPHGKVPVLKDGDHVVWESHAILRYLAAIHPDTGFWSDDPAARAQVDQWMEWSETVLQRDFIGGVFWGFYRTPEEQRDWRYIHQSVERCAAHFKLLDEMLAGGGNLLGEALTLADMTVGVHLYRYFNLDIKRPDIPNVSSWYERLQQRDGYREHVMIPFDEMFGRLAF